jgi:HEAT repeats
LRYRFLVVAFLAGGFTAQPALAVLVPMVDVPAMAQASDLIVVGRATQTENNVAPFLVTVDRVLKGNGLPRRLVVEPALSSQDYPAVQERQYGIFFLQWQPGGSYAVTDPFHPALVASPQRAPSQQKSNDVLGGLAGELIGVLTASAAPLTDPVNGVQNLVTAAPADQAQQVYYEAATALQTLPYVVAGPALGAIAASNQVPARLWAIYSLFSMVDSDDENAKADYLASVQPILINPQPGLAFAVSMLANAIEGHLKSPKAVPTLAALLGSGNVAVRRAAAAVLGDIATPDVVEPLAKIALNDSDERVGFLAVRGLALATSAAKAPTTATFRQQPDKILQFWRTWARSNIREP